MARLEGDKELDKRLKELASQSKKVENAGLKKGASHLTDELSKNAPLDPDTKYHLKTEAVYGRVTGKEGERYIKIGWTKKTSYRVHLTEFGTVHHPPQPFIDDTLKQSETRIKEIMEMEMRRVLKL